MTATVTARPSVAPGWRGAWGRMGLGKRIVSVLLAAVVLSYGIQLATESVLGGGTPGGPASSSYATGPDGYAALADLVAQRGHEVVRLRTQLAKARLDPGTTVVVADPDIVEPADAEALVEFVAGGGRLVLAGRSASPLLGLFAGTPVRWSADGVDTIVALVPSPESSAVSAVAGSGRGRYDGVGALLPVLGADGRTVVATGGPTSGSGTVVGLADSRVLANDHLGERDNAALGLALVGPGDRPVVFVESVHGYGSARGLSALPSSWRWAGLGLLLAALCGLWVAGQRFGPPERAHRQLAPARRAYVDALAADLARADPDPARAQAMRLAAQPPSPDPTGAVPAPPTGGNPP